MTEDNTFEQLKYRIMVNTNGTRSYRDNEGRLHREDGPAVVMSNGYKAWYKHGLRHREDAPARMWSDGRVEYWINGMSVVDRNGE